MRGQVATDYDVLVIGAGHAGCEAALAAARLGASVALCTMDSAAVADMPCNPAIGGPGKAHLVREIDAMGGAMAIAADYAAMQVRLLNTGKGPAVQALRVLTDKRLYHQATVQTIDSMPLIDLLIGEASEIVVRGGRCVGARFSSGLELSAGAAVLAAGVYMDSATFVGTAQSLGGPAGRAATRRLPGSLQDAGIALGRFKTGTSPRVDLGSVDLGSLRPEPGLCEPATLAHGWRQRGALPARRPRASDEVCWATYTNETTHRIIAANMGRSPLFDGTISGTGPRHCPAIEDKVQRFPERARHPVWLEREGLDSCQLYVLGMSTSLPGEVQLEMLRTLPGLARARIISPGYAIEYAFLLAGQLYPTMALKSVRGLYAAGQVCGTSGYEEAAAQGLIAGTNAARYSQGRDPVLWPRAESYLGVLADDLATRQISEPYRMMTARAEHRLHLRYANADIRLTSWARELGLVDNAQAVAAEARRQQLKTLQSTLTSKRIGPSAAVNYQLGEVGTSALTGSIRAWSLLGRPQVRYEHVCGLLPGLPGLDLDGRLELEAAAKYGGYLRQQQRILARQRKASARSLPANLDYATIPGLAARAREHLARVRPLTLGQAGRVEGVTTADLAVLLRFVRGRRPDGE